MLSDAFLDAVAFFFNGLRGSHVAVGFCLNTDGVVLELLVRFNARFEVD